MKTIKRKIVLSIFMMITMLCISCLPVLAVDTDNKIADKVITDIHKSWTINFKSSIDFSTVKSSVKVKDTSDSTYANVTIAQGNDDSSIIVNAPSEGYKLGHTYEIRVDKSIAKSKKGVNLKRTAVMNFTVESSNAANFKVEVSPILPSFKRITLSSMNNTSVKKFKVEDGELCNLGESSISITSSKSINVYFYADDGVTLLGKGVLDISKSNNNVIMQLNK